ncbi:MAG: sigma-54-dependent Fis family transcriptional regulator, partial [Proteobacteria bacterium]|nr:sigma-54-dependent Fis family transcriptional regulator [Pseudomonadota bacterium]
MKQKILLIEDTATLQMIYSANLTKAGYTVDVAATGAEGLDRFQKNNSHVVIMDLFLPDMEGIEVIRSLIRCNPQAKIIVITSNGSVNRAVEAMRAGAFDFLLKPFSDERLLATVSTALASFESLADINFETGKFYGFTGQGPVMQEMYRKIMRVAPSAAPVVLIGECGTSKETCANAIHDHSGLGSNPFITFSGVSQSAVEQDKALFGALDGPDNQAALQKAYNGTLYIPEISDIDLFVQSKLSALLRKNSLSDHDRNDDSKKFPHIICATSVDPYVLLETRKINEDLFYQLHVLTVDVPPIREIGDDIIRIAEIMLARFSKLEKKSFTGLSDDVAMLFKSHDWPGNMNQIGNMLHNVVASHDETFVKMAMLPIGFATTGAGLNNGKTGLPENRFSSERSNSAIHQLVGLKLEEVERNFIEATIQSQG